MVGCILLLIGCIQPLSAQFNPTNPPEPNVYYKVTATCKPVEGGSASVNGKYVSGTTVTMNTSAKSSNYVFMYWTLNGQYYTDSKNFQYTIENENANFVAFYYYNPSNPAEPTTINESRLWLECDPEGACSFNRTNGAKVKVDNWVTVTCYPNQNYEFLGWFADGQKVNDNASFSYQMPSSSTTLTAKFEYNYEFNPANPGDPACDGSQSDVQTQKTGDANSDGVFNVTDAVVMINYFLSELSSKYNSVFDTNKDGVINVTDAVIVVNWFLNGK